MTRFHFKCKDVGYTCTYEVDQALMKDMVPSIRIHMKYAHQIWTMPQELEEKINGAIKEIQV